MKILSVLILCASLSGCFFQSVNQYDIQDAVKFCGSLENIANIKADFLSDEYVVCMNSKSTRLHKE